MPASSESYKDAVQWFIIILHFRIHDALLTRLSNEDDMEKNLSTFASEMATSSMILGWIFVSSATFSHITDQ
jgi:hypothetical protein